MPADSKLPDSAAAALLASILDQLACPACFASLRLDSNGLICAGCQRIYPIVDGIPVVIAQGFDDKRMES